MAVKLNRTAFKQAKALVLHPGLPLRLRWVVLSAADDPFRAAARWQSLRAAEIPLWR
jgi:hypothetical protein